MKHDQQAEDGLERAKNKRRGEARRHYQEAARYFNSTNSADLRRARTSLRQALGIDPEFTSASTKLNAVTRELRARAKEEYDKGKVIQQLMDEGCDSHEEALEYYEFNQLGGWHGDKTPGFLIQMND